MITFLCLIVEDPFNEGESKISELKNVHGNGLHLGGRLIEILHLDAETEPQRLADSKIKGIEIFSFLFLFLEGVRRWKYYIRGNARYLSKRLIKSVKIFVTSMEIFDTSEYLSIYHLRNILLFKFVIKDYGRGGENVVKLGHIFTETTWGPLDVLSLLIVS